MVVKSLFLSVCDFWIEIYEHIHGRGKQTIASCIGISWGIFIMVILVGIGNAFQNGVMKLFDNFNSGLVKIDAGFVSEPAIGGVEGMRVRFDKHDVDLLRQNIAEIQYVSPLLSVWTTVSSLDAYGNFEVRGFDEDYLHMMSNQIIWGRDLNSRDFREGRRCAIVGENVSSVLFKHTDCVGKDLIVNNLPIRIVGVFKSSPTSPNDSRAVFVPSSCYFSAVDNQPQFSTLVYTSKDDIDVKDQVRKQLGTAHRFKPSDPKSIYVLSMEDQLKAFDTLFGGIRAFLWFVGISTLVGGVVGISNIMVSNVRERTREIGVRMALGATPNDVKMMILGEAIAVTSFAGICGIGVGWLILQVLNLIPRNADAMIGDLSIDMATTIFSLLIIMVAGLLSGLRPAYIASSMNPINALQSE